MEYEALLANLSQLKFIQHITILDKTMWQINKEVPDAKINDDTTRTSES